MPDTRISQLTPGTPGAAAAIPYSDGGVTLKTTPNTLRSSMGIPASFSAVATSGNYTDLNNRPLNVSSFINDANYIVGANTYLIEYIVVGGGGGGGGAYYAGGGGAGGVLTGATYVVPGNRHGVVVGAGGSGGQNAYAAGLNGLNSSFLGLIAIGGGGGGAYNSNPWAYGNDGASGGGMSGYGSDYNYRSRGIPGQGHGGGMGNGYGGGGGGGASQAGCRGGLPAGTSYTNGNNGGKGGDGLQWVNGV